LKRIIIAVAAAIVSLLSVEADAAVYVNGTGGLPCSDWLKAREEKNEEQVQMFVQWVAGFAVSHNYYVSNGSKQLPVDLDQIRFSVDKYCRDNPLASSVLFAAAQYVEDLGGATAHHNKRGKQ
jgi:hypothetical protein